MWTSDFRVGTVAIDPGGGSATAYFRAVKSSSVRPEDEIRHEIASGSIFADTVYRASAAPMASFTTEDLQGLDVNMPYGVCLTATADAGLEVYGQAQDCQGIAAAGHIKYAIKLGVMVPRSLQVDHQGIVSVTMDVYARYDGVNEPVVKSTGVTLPAEAGIIQRYTMAKMFVAGNEIKGKRSISIDWQPNVVRESADSEVYPTVVSVSDFRPRVTVRGVDTTWFGTIPASGVACTEANTYIELKAIDKARANLSHIKIAFNGLATVDGYMDANNASPAEATLVINCGKTSAGSTFPLTWSFPVTLD